MKCPYCKKGKLIFARDCIAYYPIVKGKINDADETIGELDNSWIECQDCGKTSDDEQGTLLEEIYEEVTSL